MGMGQQSPLQNTDRTQTTEGLVSSEKELDIGPCPGDKGSPLTSRKGGSEVIISKF